MQLNIRRFGGRSTYKIAKNLSLSWNGGATIDMHRGDEISVGERVFFSGNAVSEGRRLSYKTEAREYMASYTREEKVITKEGVTPLGVAAVALVLVIALLFAFCVETSGVNSAAAQVQRVEMDVESARTRNIKLSKQVEENRTDMVLLRKVIDQSDMISSGGIVPEYLTVSSSSVIRPNVGYGNEGESLFAVSQMK